MIREAIFPASRRTGIGLSPDGSTLIWAETLTGRLRHRPIVGVGEVAPSCSRPSDVLFSTPGSELLDSLAVDADGWVNVGTLVGAGITAVRPDGAGRDSPTGDPIDQHLLRGPGPPHCVCHGFIDRTVLTGTWPRAGLLAHQQHAAAVTR
jgi:gluconolactonase